MRGAGGIGGGGVDERRAGFFRIDRFARMKKPPRHKSFSDKIFSPTPIKAQKPRLRFYQRRDSFFLSSALLLVIRRQRMTILSLLFCMSLYVKRSAHCAQVYPANAG